MNYRALGQTGLQVSEIGFGGWAIGGNAFGNSYGTTEDQTSLAALNQAYELGCTFFDTADIYGHGHSEALLGQALKEWKRDEVIIATKGGQEFTPGSPGMPKLNFSETYLRQALEASLRRLGTDAIDLYQLQTPSMELIHLGRVFQVLKAFQQEGKIRFYGISIHDPMEGIQAIEVGQVQTVQAVYNLLDRRPERALLAKCQEQGIGFIAREPLANGFLTGKFTAETSFESGDMRARWPKPYLAKRVQAAEHFKQALPPTCPTLTAMALRFPLAHPAVSTVIPGCKTPVQALENMKASDLAPLSAEALQHLEALQHTIF